MTVTREEAEERLKDAPPEGRKALALLGRRLLEERERRLKAEQEKANGSSSD